MNQQTELKAALERFTGTLHYYRHWTGLIFTDGVKFLGDTYGLYWLIDTILIHTRQNPVLALRHWMSWSLTRIDGTDSFRLTAQTDTHQPLLHEEIIPFSDFKADQLTLWLEGDTLIVPNEH